MSGLIKYFLENSKNFLEGVSFVIIEPNKGMVEKHKNKLEEFLNLGIDILWKGLEEVEENNINGIVLANEVLDALPVERITFSKGKLLRQAVSIDKKSHKLFFDEMPITSELEKNIEVEEDKNTNEVVNEENIDEISKLIENLSKKWNSLSKEEKNNQYPFGKFMNKLNWDSQAEKLVESYKKISMP